MESSAISSVEALISALENDEPVGSVHGDEIEIDYDMLPLLLGPYFERFRKALWGTNTLITAVEIDVENSLDREVSLGEFEVLGEVFAELESLESLELSTGHSRTGYANLTAAAALLRQTTQIRRFRLWVCGRSLHEQEHGFDAQPYADALIHLLALETMTLTGLSPEESGLITTALPSLFNLESLTLGSEEDESTDDSIDVSTILHDEALERVLQLETLREVSLHRCLLSERNLLTISNYLSSGSHLTWLALYSCQFPENGCESLSASLKHNRTLEALCFSLCAPGDAFFQSLKDSLSSNNSLGSLWVGDNLSKQSATDLVAAVRGNYSLVSVHPNNRASSTNGIDENQASILRCISRLNQAGRRYIVEDPTSAEKGFHVLMQVKEDLDSLWVHLQENPLLCTELLRRVVLSLDGKRGSAIDQEDEKPSAAKKRRVESCETDQSE